MKLTIEIELQSNMEELLIDKINDYCMDWFGKKPVLHKHDVSGQSEQLPPLPEIGTKEFNDLCEKFFGGNCH